MKIDYSVLFKDQMDHIYAQEPVDNEGFLTVYALGGFVPEDEDEAKKFLETSPAYIITVGGGGDIFSKFTMPKFIEVENNYRLMLVAKMNEFIRVIRKSYCSIRKASRRSELSRTMVELLKARCPLFDRMIKDAYEDASDKLEEAGFKRAVDGVVEDVYYRGVKCGEKRVYSDSVLVAMLKGRKSDVYGKVDVQSNVSISNAPTINPKIRWESMTDEERAVARKMLEESEF